MDLPAPTHAFIGGSAGNMGEILDGAAGEESVCAYCELTRLRWRVFPK